MGSGISNPWLEIWLSPKKTIRAILNQDPKKMIAWLALIGGIFSAFVGRGYVWGDTPEGRYLHQMWIFLLILIGGGILGIVSLYLGGWLYKLTGGWIGGKGSFTEIKCAVGWSFYPAILTHIASLISIGVVPHPWLQGTIGLITVVLGVWSFVILLNMVGEAHRFSAWRALLAFILTLVLIFLTIMIVFLLIPLLAPLFY